MTSAENPQQLSSGSNLDQFKGQIILPFSFIYCSIATNFISSRFTMDITFLLGTKIIELTLIVLIGYGLVKSKLLKSEDSKPLSIIGLYVISPSVMIEAFQIDYTPEILQGLQLSLLMAVFLQVILIIIGSLLKRLLNLDPIEHATSIYSNSGNLIIPIVMSLFGKEWVIYASCFIVVQTFLFWTHCRLIIVGKGNLSLKTIAKNINIWSILVGAFLFAFQIKLPNIINGTLSSHWFVYWSECHACCGYADCCNSFTKHRSIQTHLFSHTIALVDYSACIIGINKADWLCALG